MSVGAQRGEIQLAFGGGRMSYVALATNNYEEVVAFYGHRLGFPVVEQWDRPNARGQRFDLGGMRLEVFDNSRERCTLELNAPADRFHIVVEVNDIEEAWWRIDIDAPGPKTVSWGARLFELHDPDGVPVTFLQWLRPSTGARDRIYGRIESGTGKAQHFTQLNWARAQFTEKLGIDPYPGTLNLTIQGPDSFAAWVGLCSTPGIRIESPNNGHRACDARCYRVSVDGDIDAAIVLPEIEAYPESRIEIIASVMLRDALGKGDGDEVVLELGKRVAMAEPLTRGAAR